ncbi:MAG: hypothetical protein ACRDF7_08040 [Candidatus Limnocylindrales bacterium]
MNELAAFDDVELLLIDGNNLLHRTAGGPGEAGARILLARLRAVMPVHMEAVVVLDGPPDPGAPMREQASRHLQIRHAGRLSADDVIVGLVADRSFVQRPRTTVVSDDRALRDRVTRIGGLARRLAWLIVRLEMPPRGPRVAPGSSIAGSRPRRPAPARPPEPTDDASTKDADAVPERRWQPGRGATRKRGNAHRGRTRG